MLNRRTLLTSSGMLLPAAAFAQAAPAPARRRHGPRDEWLEMPWDGLAPEQRRQADERFARGMGAQRPTPDEMRQRWDSMSPGQRRELMRDHARGPRHARGGSAAQRPG